jgi:hypothetical protein
MRAHIDQTTRQILGYYPESIDYPTLPPANELETITNEQHQALLAINAWGLQADGTVIQNDPNPAPPPPPPTLEQRLAALGLSVPELKKLLRESKP